MKWCNVPAGATTGVRINRAHKQHRSTHYHRRPLILGTGRVGYYQYIWPTAVCWTSSYFSVADVGAKMREEDLIERLPSSDSSSDSSSEDEGQETVISKPTGPPPQKRLAATTSDDKKKDDNEVEYLYGQNFYQLRDQCLKEGNLFEDPEVILS